MSKKDYRMVASTEETFVDAKVINYFESTADSPAYKLFTTHIIFDGDMKGRKWKRDDDKSRCRWITEKDWKRTE